VIPTHSKRTSLLATIPLWTIVGICSLLPLAWMLAQVLTHPSAWTSLRPSAFQLSLLARTVFYNGAAALLATAISIPAAIVIGRGRGFFSKTLILLLPLGLLIPSITYGYGWVQIFRLAGITIDPGGPADIARCIWTLAAWLWPLPAISIGLALRYMDSQVQQQALLDGALFRITARQLAGPALASFAIVMILAMQEFAVYERGSISVFATEIRTIFETGAFASPSNPVAGVISGGGSASPDQPQRAAIAIATAAPMLLIVSLLSIAVILSIRRLSSAAEIDIPNWPRILNAGPVSKISATLLILVTLIAPIAAMVLSISPYRWHADSAGHSMPVRILLWAWPQTFGSLSIGLAAGLVAFILGALSCVRRARPLLLLALLSFLIGGELLAIADIRIYNRATPWPLSSLGVSGRELFGLIYNSALVMVIAYLGRFAWLTLLAGHGGWSGAMRELRDVAAIDGAGPWRTAAAVVWPLLWPMLAAASVLVVILSITEVGASVLLAPQRPPMMVPMLMQWVHMLRNDEVLEGALLLVVLVVLLGAGFVMLMHLGFKITAFLRRSALPIVAIALLIIAGCDDGKQPEAIWFETGVGPNQTVYPRGICYSKKDDCFFLVDRMARIQRINHDGKTINEWRMPNWERGKPTGLSVGPDGNVYIADTHYARVAVYSPTGQFLKDWGTFGREPGQFIYPTDVAFDKSGNIYVSEYGDNDRIQIFDPNTLKVIRTIGHFGQEDAQFARPQSMVIDDETLYVTDACNHRIAVFNINGTFLRHIGSIGTSLGQFRFPYGLDEDTHGHLIVTEFGNNRVQLIDKQTGKGLATWGLAGRESGQLAYPWASAVDRNGRIVTVDSGNNRLQVFKF
jgi:ABC-type Fe3+ transport system permease subunit/DNA-binding beta-propeller fold protein YncE